MRLFVVLILIPIIEIGLFIEVGGWIGTWPTIGIIVLTALLGSWLLRRQGLQAMRDVQSRLNAGDPPGQLLVEGALILCAGMLLLTPGFFTDALGFLLLVPPFRALIWRRIAARITVRAATNAGPGWHFHSGDTVVDGEFTEAGPESGTGNRPDKPGNSPGAPALGRPDHGG